MSVSLEDHMGAFSLVPYIIWVLELPPFERMESENGPSTLADLRVSVEGGASGSTCGALVA